MIGYGLFEQYPLGLVIIGVVLTVLVLGYTGARFWLWATIAGLVLWGSGAALWLWVLWALVSGIFIVKPLRRGLVSAPAMKIANKLDVLPTIGDTERIALEAGTTWLEGDIFAGRLDFDRISNESYPELSDAERAFLEGPAETLCQMVNQWNVHQRNDLPPEAWEFIKDERFFGMVIPEEYGGHGFSAYGMNAVVAKLGSCSIALAVDVMVPNSLGPAELLIQYGTEEQKDHYLPRLARGDEIPCFALTEPAAGSDAAALTSHGEVFEDEKGDLCIRLNWHKRYITLAPIATLLGLSFELEDPDNLLGQGAQPGITLALVPTDLEGVEIGERHNPLNTPFINGPTEGHDVVISADQIIGGPGEAGSGWRMLNENLAAGRGIFLPAMNTGGAKLAARIAGAYAIVRQQFGLPIARFEGVQELLAPIGGFTYLLDALSRFTCGALDEGAKPSVISAIAKYNSSEINRTIVDHTMDILGGKGIILGPHNLMGHAYQAVPIGITVEGSNVVTRSLIVFGQGLIRSHPYAFQELDALEKGDTVAFDKAFWKHIHQIVNNIFRAGLISLTRGSSAPVSRPLTRYKQRLIWAVARFALLADIALLSLGGELKLRERLSGRFADSLSAIYMALAALRKFEADGQPTHDEVFVKWAVETMLHRVQSAFEDITHKFPVPWLRWWLAGPTALWFRLNPISTGPSDELSANLADVLTNDDASRDALIEGIHLPEGPVQTLEKAFKLALQTLPLYSRIREAVREGKIEKDRAKHLIDAALEADVITQDEFSLLKEAAEARQAAIQVDSFSSDKLPMMQ